MKYVCILQIEELNLDNTRGSTEIEGLTEEYTALHTLSLIVTHSLGVGGQLAQETSGQAGAEQDRKHVNINLDISEHSAAVVTAIREAGQTLEAIERSLRPGSLLAVYLLGQVSLSVLGWLLHLGTRLAGAALTLAAHTLIMAAVDLYS